MMLVHVRRRRGKVQGHEDLGPDSSDAEQRFSTTAWLTLCCVAVLCMVGCSVASLLFATI